METIAPEIGKYYKTRHGRIVRIESLLFGYSDVVLGIVLNRRKDDCEIERWKLSGKHWTYLSLFSSIGYRELNLPEWDLVAEIPEMTALTLKNEN